MKRKKITIENLAIINYAAEGKAIGKVDGKVIFVEGAVPGDVADVFITRNKKDWAEGKAIKIKEFSKERVTPFCIHFGVCGGCKWQMLPYEKQLQYKQQEAADAFRRIGKFSEVPMLPIVGSDDTIHYRNKLEFTFSNKKFLTPAQLEDLQDDPWPGAALGYHVPRLYDKIIDIYECWLMDDVNNTIRNTLRNFSLSNNYSYYDIKEHKGWLRNVIIRNSTTGGLMVNLIFGYDYKK
jgi:23S rRNA (uracil1939-C5)-methyltransferase